MINIILLIFVIFLLMIYMIYVLVEERNGICIKLMQKYKLCVIIIFRGGVRCIKNVDLVFDNVFKEYYGKNKLLFNNYKKIYNLPTVTSECNVSKKLYQYCLRKKYFILLLIYDDEGKIYFDRNMSDILCWGLPGGSVKDTETINHALNRITQNINRNIIIGYVEPVTLIENVFNYCEDKFVHYGMDFIARIRNKYVIDNKKLIGDFIEITDEEFSYINRLASKKVVEIFKDRFDDIMRKTGNCFQDVEVSTNEEYKNRYKFHNDFMKKFILTEKRKKKAEFTELIKNNIKDANSIIDVSCGEDKFIFDLSRDLGINLVVGNDISWSQIELLNNNYQEVIFTNHNAASLPFMEKVFDVAYCSNTLHHMPNKKTLISLLNSMERIAKKIVIVEIENPSIVGGFPKILNKYWYMKFLKDVGGAYLSEQQFQLIINNNFSKKYNIEFQKFENIMGKYMIAIIEERK